MMTREEMYRILEEKHKETGWRNIQSIRAYNQYAQMLRHMVYESEERGDGDVSICNA